MAPSRALIPFQSICVSCLRRQQFAARRLYSTPAGESPFPRVANVSFWSGLVPKPFRRQQTSPDAPSPLAKRSRFLTRPRDWNPYTIFILLGLLAGSNAIQILALRNDTVSYTRKTEAKLDLLREVVQKVKNGEEVDVRKALGTGDEEAEREWEEAVKEMEETDTLVEGWKKKAEKRRLKEEARHREGGGPTEAKDPGRSAVAKEAEPDSKADERRPKFLM
jgi:hypothetical protein